VNTAVSQYVALWLVVDRELSSSCLWSVPQLTGLTRLIVSPSELDDQILLNIADSCFNLQRLVLVDDRYSEHITRQAAQARKVRPHVSAVFFQADSDSRTQLNSCNLTFKYVLNNIFIQIKYEFLDVLNIFQTFFRFFPNF